MSKAIRYILAAIAILVAAVAILAIVVQPASAGQVNYDNDVCHAFSSYERTHYGPTFHRMVVESRHADTYLRYDVALWAHDLKHHASRATLANDRLYVFEDCTYSPDQGS